MSLKSVFDRVVVVNLRRRPDRKQRLLEAMSQCDWPFAEPEFFEAIDGSSVPTPTDWRSGGGAWGCMRSHQQIFERAIMDGVDNLLVLEDDACFIEGFRSEVQRFLEIVPADWDQLMLGGQHVNVNGKPILVKPGVYRCSDCERTHGYAIRSGFMRKLYQRWASGGKFNGEVHCDWIMGRDIDMQSSHAVYAPERFLIGQERGRSDVNGGVHPRKFWNPPAPDLPVIYLETTPNVIAELRRYGLHTGFQRDLVTDLDKGLCTIFNQGAFDESRLRNWLNEIQWEVASDPFLMCTVWHPKASEDLVRRVSTWPVLAVRAGSVEEALGQLPTELRRKPRRSLATEYVVHLEAPRHVMDVLRHHGWHNGHWRNETTGVDRGLEQILEDHRDPKQRTRDLGNLITLLQTEAESLTNGVPTLWHANLDFELIQSATDARVVSIKADNSREAIDCWEDIIRGRGLLAA